MNGHLSQHLHRSVRIFLSPCALKSLDSTERIQPRMMCASFNGNPCTKIISCFSPTDASDETDFINKNQLSSFVQYIPKHNVLIISGDIYVKTKMINSAYTTHRIEMVNIKQIFLFKNRLACLNTKFQKSEVEIRIYIYPNNSKAQLDYIFINKKWINSTLNCERYSFFERIFSDNQNVSAKIRLI